MLDSLPSHYHYWLTITLMMIGFYMIIASENLIRKLIGLNIFQVSVFILFISMGYLDGGTAPIATSMHVAYAAPLPQVLILTAIVVGIATTALGLALTVRIYRAYGSINEREIGRLDQTP